MSFMLKELTDYLSTCILVILNYSTAKLLKKVTWYALFREFLLFLQLICRY